LQQAIETKGISFLLHFTRIENLHNILTNGLIPRSTLEATNSSFIFNDTMRIDGYKNASCCSIQHPNYKMFYSLRQQYPNTEWVVLGIRTNILWEKNCAFCYTNAASSTILSTPLADLQGVQAFNKMFEDIYTNPTRSILNIPNNYPTDPQAEILIFDVIEPHYIIGAIFQNPTLMEIYKLLFPEKMGSFALYPPFFSYRHDYLHWKNDIGN